MQSGAGARNAALLLLRDLISERTGVYFEQSTLDLMEGKISDLMADRGIDSIFDYYYLLKYEGPSGDEWTKLLNAISVRETYFWREFDQIRTLVDVIVPRLARTATGPLRIWSAACATGDEPLTIAMALDQAGWLDRIPLEIHATDMSSAALCTAERGIYRERAFRSCHRNCAIVTSGVFRRLGNRSRNSAAYYMASRQSDESIGNRMAGTIANDLLQKCFYLLFGACDPSSCQNVCGMHAHAGYLFVGAAESLLKFTSEFQLRQIEGAFVYVKE
jgi:chemotaxis protein methyltransferase CheR